MKKAKFVAAVVVALATAGAPGRADVDDSLEGIIARALAASGGAEKLKAVQAVRMSGRITFGSDPASPFTVELKRPGRIRTEITFPKGLFVQAFDGRTAWAINPWKHEPAAEMTPAETRDIAEAADMDGPLLDWKTRGMKLELLGREDVEAKPAWKIRVTQASGTVRTLFLDASSHLKVKWEGTLGEGRDATAQESVFSAYRKVDGVPFPFRIRSRARGGGQEQEIVFERVEVNPTIDDSRFLMPRTSFADAK